ncbi:MAG: DUF5615 family PIN-like protein [Pirellulales bacterium]|nr:DUF5615 family PIN-like protein [Pirellulales bacterium]
MAIRFHLDENVSGAVAAALRRRGVDVTTSLDAGLIGADDSAHLQFAIAQHRVYVTHDDDFTQHHARGVEHAGICCCHKTRYSVGELVQLLLLVDACLSQESMRGHLEFL